MINISAINIFSDDTESYADQMQNFANRVEDNTLNQIENHYGSNFDDLSGTYDKAAEAYKDEYVQYVTYAREACNYYSQIMRLIGEELTENTEKKVKESFKGKLWD